MEDISIVTEGALAVVLWRFLYDLFAFIGFEKAPYIGIAINTLFVSMTAVTGVKIAKKMYGNDVYRLRRFILLFSFCGIFWLFAAMHLRDALVLLAVTILVLFWVRYLELHSIWNICWLVLATAFAFVFMSFLRTEFFFVPLAMTVAGMASLILGNSTNRNNRKLVFVTSGIFMLLLIILSTPLLPNLLDMLVKQGDVYKLKSIIDGGDESLGVKLIVQQPFPVKMLLGTAYLFFFPIPFWSGFQLESSYYLFKSFQTIFMYWLTPIVVITIWLLIKNKKVRTPSLLFLLFVSFGFSISIALTSMETRHFGTFLVPMIALAIFPDFRHMKIKRAYKSLLLIFILMIMFVHIYWISLKYL